MGFIRRFLQLERYGLRPEIAPSPFAAGLVAKEYLGGRLVNVPGFDQTARSHCFTAKCMQNVTALSMVVSSSRRKAGGVPVCRNINNFTDCD
ncbi:hypothetical protein TNCV_4291741 [Trichonephila clavipes]|uniref:Uncharacterized protein n=1 Tax=Trichonephila clavipes TaxID=2585209 RepID=A0A8X6V4F3_TRICX|nr:hypothetical protein TNCV_4291741 [Trichonephila clavipes]